MNIYITDDWNSSSSYATNSIVAWPAGSTTYWYATSNLASNGGDEPSLSNPNWGGRIAVDSNDLITNQNGIPKFIWAPSYNPSKKVEAKVKQIQFGEGYRQIIADGINNTLLKVDVIFEGRDTYETGAIIHFLNARQGGETFIWIPPSPYAAVKRWKCLSWSDDQPFYDNYAIRAPFEEVLV